MAGLEETLGSILSNEEAMGQIMSLAQSLGAGAASDTAAKSDAIPHTEAEGATLEGSVIRDTPPNASAPGFDLGMLSELTGSLDPSMMQFAFRMLSEFQNTNRQDEAAVLEALRPFLKEKRQKNIDTAIRLAKLSGVLRVALRSMKGGEDRV